MNSPQKPSASVIAAAVIAILAGLFFLLSSSLAMLAFSLTKLSNTSAEFPPVVRTMMLIMTGCMICLSIFGIATAIGVLALRNWARISILIWGGMFAFFGVLGIPVAFLMPLTTPPGPALPPGAVQTMRWILLVIYGLPLAIGTWWLILFNRKSVKAQFSVTATPSDSGVPQKPRSPLPITVLAWLYITAILNLIILPIVPFHTPVFVFGLLLPDRVGLTLLILTSLAFTVCGVGLLKLKPWSYSLTMGLQVFWLASTAVSMLRPNYKTAMESSLKQMENSMHLPESQFSSNPFLQHFGWILALGLLFAGAILGLFIYYRQRFLAAASAAASSR